MSKLLGYLMKTIDDLPYPGDPADADLAVCISTLMDLETRYLKLAKLVMAGEDIQLPNPSDVNQLQRRLSELTNLPESDEPVYVASVNYLLNLKSLIQFLIELNAKEK